MEVIAWTIYYLGYMCVRVSVCLFARRECGPVYDGLHAVYMRFTCGDMIFFGSSRYECFICFVYIIYAGYVYVCCSAVNCIHYAILFIFMLLYIVRMRLAI